MSPACGWPLQAITQLLILGGFTTGALARDARGLIVDPEDETAVAWCVVGATIKVCGRSPVATAALLEVKRRAGLPILFRDDVSGLAPLSDRIGLEGVVVLLKGGAS